ncbi:MAG: ShlB/FhaC/HecB family hemolysin secretion/activation protein, partial [Cyanobium sp.]
MELPAPADGFSSSQYQGLGQLEWVFSETLRGRWSISAGFCGNRSNSYINDQALPEILPEVVRRPSNGYLRLALGGSGIADRVGWRGNAYLLQGVAAATPERQREELALVDIDPGQATALGGIVSLGWAFAPSWQLNVRGAGQLAVAPLTSPMQFSLGSDVGIRGLPGQLISGDNGWLGTAEVVWTAWQNK